MCDEILKQVDSHGLACELLAIKKHHKCPPPPQAPQIAFHRTQHNKRNPYGRAKTI